jgi:hypothetical protein
MTDSPIECTAEVEARAKERQGKISTRPPVENEPPDFARGLLTAERLATLEIPPRPALLGSWLKEGDLCYIFAPRGVGKSWLAALIGKAVAEGQGLGRWAAGEEPRPVFYVDCEMNLPDLKERFAKVRLDSEKFTLLSNEYLFQQGVESINIADPAHQEVITGLLPPGSLLILDNLSTAQRGMKENDNDDFDQIRIWLLQLRHLKITTILVHHAGRNGEMRGASRREDMAHSIISLTDATPDGGPKRFHTRFTKNRNCRPSDEALALVWTLADGADGIYVNCETHSGPDVMLEHIKEGVDSAGDLAELLGVQAGTVSKWAKKLESRGKVTIRGRKYHAIGTQPF